MLFFLSFFFEIAILHIIILMGPPRSAFNVTSYCISDFFIYLSRYSSAEEKVMQLKVKVEQPGFTEVLNKVLPALTLLGFF